MPQNIFYFHFKIAEIFEFESGSAGHHTLQSKKKTIFKKGGSLRMDTISLV
jgi:hypothetical protein